MYETSFLSKLDQYDFKGMENSRGQWILMDTFFQNEWIVAFSEDEFSWTFFNNSHGHFLMNSSGHFLRALLDSENTSVSGQGVQGWSPC